MQKGINLNEYSIKEVEKLVGRPALDVEVRKNGVVLQFPDCRVHLKNIKK